MANVNEGERWSAAKCTRIHDKLRAVVGGQTDEPEHLLDVLIAAWNEMHREAKESDYDALAEQLQGAVEAERAEILTLLQEMADAEPRMSEARITILMAAKRIHERGRVSLLGRLLMADVNEGERWALNVCEDCGKCMRVHPSYCDKTGRRHVGATNVWPVEVVPAEALRAVEYDLLAVVDMWRGRFEDAASRETGLHEALRKETGALREAEAEVARLREAYDALVAKHERAECVHTNPCGCNAFCGDDGDIDGPGTCKGLPAMPHDYGLPVLRLVMRRSAESETGGHE